MDALRQRGQSCRAFLRPRSACEPRGQVIATGRPPRGGTAPVGPSLLIRVPRMDFPPAGSPLTVDKSKCEWVNVHPLRDVYVSFMTYGSALTCLAPLIGTRECRQLGCRHVQHFTVAVCVAGRGQVAPASVLMLAKHWRLSASQTVNVGGISDSFKKK